MTSLPHLPHGCPLIPRAGKDTLKTRTRDDRAHAAIQQ